ncbi:hypothetical protein HC891_01720 [Candidatus Gracilibacteria bacterium]|nr:hypothetical protein [Candidatus Gracilibacteria bacterium]
MAQYRIEASTITHAPPEAVWAVLDDFRGWSRWMPAMEQLQIELPAGQKPGPGYRLRLRGALVSADLQITDFSALRRATTFRINFPPFTGTNSCQVTPLGDGRYQVDRIDAIDMPEALVGFLQATQRERFERLAAEFLAALVGAVEARVADGKSGHPARGSSRTRAGHRARRAARTVGANARCTAPDRCDK